MPTRCQSTPSTAVTSGVAGTRYGVHGASVGSAKVAVGSGDAVGDGVTRDVANAFGTVGGAAGVSTNVEDGETEAEAEIEDGGDV